MNERSFLFFFTSPTTVLGCRVKFPIPQCLRVVVGFFDVIDGDVEKHLMSLVPGVERPLSSVLAHHGDVKVLVVAGAIRVLITRGLLGA